MSGCFYPECHRLKKGKTHLFRAPKTADRKRWLEKIPKREIPFDFEKSRLCSRHFDSHYVQKNFPPYKVRGEPNVVPRKNWRLAHNAIPTHFPGKTHETTDEGKDSSSCDENELKELLVSCLTLSELISKRNEISTPNSSWIFGLAELNGEEIFRAVYLNDFSNCNSIPVAKSITVNPGLVVEVRIGGKIVTNLDTRVDSLDQFESLLDSVDRLRLCEGVKGYDAIDYCSRAKKMKDVWFANDCEIVAETSCESCKELSVRLCDQWTQMTSLSEISKKRTFI